MSRYDAEEPVNALDAANAPIELVISGRPRDLGGFEVRRILPSPQRQMIGPFIFFDQMGPAQFAPGRGVDVRPHPHIGLATVTYLFSGEVDHRDSLGSFQTILPGEVNWMTAGAGIAHSERTPAAVRSKGPELYGVQAWVALPKPFEECAPAFAHVGVNDLPVLHGEGWRARLIAGSFEGEAAPTPVASPTVYADVTLSPGGRFVVPTEHRERALFLVSGAASVDGYAMESGALLVLPSARSVEVRASDGARVLLLGGETTDGPRHIWWNFVSSSQERIEQAKHDWTVGRFAKVPGESEFIPLPGT